MEVFASDAGKKNMAHCDQTVASEVGREVQFVSVGRIEKDWTSHFLPLASYAILKFESWMWGSQLRL